jgi:hypothetical protein
MHGGEGETVTLYTASADWLKRAPGSQMDKCAVPKDARNPLFNGTSYVPGRPANWSQLSDSEKRQWRNRRAMVIVDAEELLSLKKTKCCAGRVYKCSSLEGRDCWKYDVNDLALANGKPLRCRECLLRGGKL